MVSPKRPQNGSPIKPCELFPTKEEPGFQKKYAAALLKRCGNLPYDKSLNDLHSTYPEFLPFMTAKAIRMQFLEEGVPEIKIPTMEELIQMVQYQLN